MKTTCLLMSLFALVLAGCKASVQSHPPVATISIAHARAVAGWELKVEAKTTDLDARLRSVTIRVNGSPIANGDVTFSTPLDTWSGEFHNIGRSPGENKVEVAVMDLQGNVTRSQQDW